MPHSKGFASRRDRRSVEAVSIGEIVERLMEEDILRRGLPIAKLARAWPEIVGERLGEATKPLSLEGGILTVRAADGPWGAQAKYLAEEIRTRADAALGAGSVSGIRVVVDDARNRR
jgi:hypothetical protein